MASSKSLMYMVVGGCMRDKGGVTKKKEQTSKPSCSHVYTRGKRGILQMSKPKPLPNPSRPSPRLTRHAFSHSSFFFLLSAIQLVTPDIPRLVSRGLSHPAMFSSIPFLFVYPYMPIFMFFSYMFSFFEHQPSLAGWGQAWVIDIFYLLWKN
ncbi:hypothetical protein J3F84DRAFT_356171 [Trichoderma pleuroticola]